MDDDVTRQADRACDMLAGGVPYRIAIAHAQMSDDLLAEHLKDIAYDLGLASLQAMRRTGRDSWTTIEVRHAALWGDSRDGWDVTIKQESL